MVRSSIPQTRTSSSFRQGATTTMSSSVPCKGNDGQCGKRSSWNWKGSAVADFCSEHAAEGMVSLRTRRCSHDGCSTTASLNVKGSKKAKFCRVIAEPGMVRVTGRLCSQDGCTKAASFTLKGKSPRFCRKHAAPDMINVCVPLCADEGCSRTALCNVEGSKAGNVAGNTPRLGW